jgi:hypothetical protein
MRFKFFLILPVLFACSEDSNPTYPFERTVLDVSIAKRCIGSSSAGTNCILLRWQHPIEKKDLESYYIWLDTTVVKDSAETVSQSQINNASSTVSYNGRDEADSLDLTSLISSFLKRDSLHIAIWAKYTGNEQGFVRHIYVHFGDDISPGVIHLDDSVSVSTIWIDWLRPTDQRDFYLPENINGPIAGYSVAISAVNETENLRNAAIKAFLDGKDLSDSVRPGKEFIKSSSGAILTNASNAGNYSREVAIIDGKGFISENTQANKWRIEVSGLRPESSYNVAIVAYDSAGNTSTATTRVATTDPIAPLIASKFWLYKDLNDGLPRLDSNRLILFWPRSLDPLDNPTQIEIDSVIRIPGFCILCSYREVKSYSLELRNGNSWEAVPRSTVIEDGYYNARYSLENSSMKPNYDGMYISDTLRWVLPGDSVILRIRAIDGSGHYSKAWIDTIVVSMGELGQKIKCPNNSFAAVRKDTSSVFCMEKLQHTSNNKFQQNILYIEAKKSCEELGKETDFKNFTVNLCTEEEWDAACNSGGSPYGIIQENYPPNTFLSQYCGVGTGDSSSANTLGKRNKICSSPDGIRDLPGQLQEWVIGKGDSGDVPLLKGSSYAIFQGASKVELAQCKNRFTPTRIRPKYTTDTVWLYRSGSRIDTLMAKDPFRTSNPTPLLPSSFKDTILIYTLKSENLAGNPLVGEDYVNQAEYRRRGGDEWIKVLWRGLKYELKEKRRVLILGTEKINATAFFLDPTAGFRCCAKAN